MLALLLANLAVSCTSARWTVKDRDAIDQAEYEVVSQHRFLAKSGEVTPENPSLSLELKSRTEYRYSQRILAERNIQDYRLRPGHVALGLAGGALAFYAANSAVLSENRSSTRVWTLNSVGVLLTASGFLNMKAVGQPKPTGEERLLRSTGDTLRVDTLQVQQNVEAAATVSIDYGDITISDQIERQITNGSLDIPLADEVANLQLTGADPGNIKVDVTFEDSVYTYNYAVSDILQPYARVTTQFSSLRNSPGESSDNIVADLVEGSQVRILGSSEERWYRVLYGISEHYLLKENSEIVWRPSDFAQKNEVVTVPRLPFGRIDVESNIPILRSDKENGMALILTNENYPERFEDRRYAHRDGQLIRTYLEDALGYSSNSIYELQDVGNPQALERTLSEMRMATNDSTEITVYLSGYGAIDEKGEGTELVLLGDNAEGEEPVPLIELGSFFRQLATLTTGQTLVLSDIDFSYSELSGGYTANRARRILESKADNLVARNSRAAVLFGTRLTQPSSLYFTPSGEDKKHHIFPYYFAKALQQRKTSLSAIYQYLERNVSYTARKMHDRPQDPLLIGNSLLDLRNE